MSETPFLVESTYLSTNKRHVHKISRADGSCVDYYYDKDDAQLLCDRMNAVWVSAGGPELTRQRDEAIELLNRMHAKLSRILVEGGHLDSDDLASIGDTLVRITGKPAALRERGE